jgi:carbonic anhydrase
MSTPLTRRSMFGLAAALACPLCGRAFAADARHWSYEGTTGPEHWGDLQPISTLARSERNNRQSI